MDTRTSRKLVSGVVESKDEIVNIREKLINILLTKQYENKTVNKYVTHFKTNIKSIKIVGGKNVLSNEVIMDQKLMDLVEKVTEKEKKNYLS